MTYRSDSISALIELVEMAPEDFAVGGAAPGWLIDCGSNGCVFRVDPGRVIKVGFYPREAQLAASLTGPRRADFLPEFHAARVAAVDLGMGLDRPAHFGVILREDLEDFPMPGPASAYPDAVMTLLADEPDPRQVVNEYLDGLTNLEAQGVLAIGNLLLWGDEQGIYFDKLEFAWEEDEDWQPGEDMILPNAVSNLGVTAEGRVVIRDLGNFSLGEGAALNPRRRKPITTEIVRDNTRLVGGRDLVVYARAGKTKIGHLQVFRAKPAELTEACQADLRKAQGSRPGIVAYVVWKSHVTERRRGKGIGKKLYEAALDYLREKHHPGAVALVPMHCLSYGSTSAEARRVWTSLSRRPHSTERAVLANPRGLLQHFADEERQVFPLLPPHLANHLLGEHEEILESYRNGVVPVELLEHHANSEDRIFAEYTPKLAPSFRRDHERYRKAIRAGRPLRMNPVPGLWGPR